MRHRAVSAPTNNKIVIILGDCLTPAQMAWRIILTEQFRRKAVKIKRNSPRVMGIYVAMPKTVQTTIAAIKTENAITKSIAARSFDGPIKAFLTGYRPADPVYHSWPDLDIG